MCIHAVVVVVEITYDMQMWSSLLTHCRLKRKHQKGTWHVVGIAHAMQSGGKELVTRLRMFAWGQRWSL